MRHRLRPRFFVLSSVAVALVSFFAGIWWYEATAGRTRWPGVHVWSAYCERQPAERLHVYRSPDGGRVMVRIDRGKWGDEVYVIDLGTSDIWLVESKDLAFPLRQAYLATGWHIGLRVKRGAVFDVDHDPKLLIETEPDAPPNRRLDLRFNAVWSGETEFSLDTSHLQAAPTRNPTSFTATIVTIRRLSGAGSAAIRIVGRQFGPFKMFQSQGLTARFGSTSRNLRGTAGGLHPAGAIFDAQVVHS